MLNNITAALPQLHSDRQHTKNTSQYSFIQTNISFTSTSKFHTICENQTKLTIPKNPMAMLEQRLQSAKKTKSTLSSNLHILFHIPFLCTVL